MKPDRSAAERFVRGESTNAYEFFGCRFLSDSLCRFAVYAPNAAAVSLTGDFNGWVPAPMARVDGGVWIASAEAKQGDVYKYAVTDRSGRTVLKSDPFAFHWETPPATGSKVWDIGGYEWHDADYLARRRAADPIHAPMSVYEVHLGSWRAPAEGAVFPDYRSMADALAAYCLDMGYTHVEPMPLNEYPYAPSWGYQVLGYFAPTSRYGTPQDFKYFVDTLHRNGIGVILDWVPAHFPRDEHGLARFDGTPLYERSDPKMAAHPDWGTLIFDYEKPAVRSFLLSSAAMLLDEYHIDGIRVDAVTSMLLRSFGRGGDFVPNRFGGEEDLGAIALLRDFNDLVRSRGAVSIAEESSAFPGVTAMRAEGGLGFTFKWDMGFMHDTLDYMELDPLWRRGSHNKLTFSMLYAFSEHFTLAFSHDEVVYGKKSLIAKMPGSYDEKFSNLRVFYGFVFAHPGKKHTFMGSDFAQFSEWDYHRELDWFLLDYPRHRELQSYVRALNGFYTSHAALWQRDDGWYGFEWLNVDDADRSSVAFLRRGDDGEAVVCACNFTPVQWEFQIGLPCAGTLRRVLDSDDVRFGGAGLLDDAPVSSVPEPFSGRPCSAFLTLPPLSCVYYLFDGEEKT